MGDPLNPTENRLKRLVVSEDCLIKKLGTSVASGHSPVKHDAANRLAQLDLMLTNVEHQSSEGPFPGQKRKSQSVSEATEGKGTCGRRQPVRSLQVHALKHPRQQQFRGIVRTRVIFLTRLSGHRVRRRGRATRLPEPETVASRRRGEKAGPHLDGLARI